MDGWMEDNEDIVEWMKRDGGGLEEMMDGCMDGGGKKVKI